MSKEKVELEKNRLLHRAKNPNHARVYIDERNKWMTFNLHKLMFDWTEGKYTMCYLQKSNYDTIFLPLQNM